MPISVHKLGNSLIGKNRCQRLRSTIFRHEIGRGKTGLLLPSAWL